MKIGWLCGWTVGFLAVGSVWAQGGPMRLGGNNASNAAGAQPGAAAGPAAAPGRGPGGPMRLGDDSRRNRLNKRGYGRGKGQEIDTKVLDPKILKEELALEYNQEREVEQIFREYEAALRDLKMAYKQGNTQQEMKRLEQDLEMARRANDVQRSKEIWSKLAELRRSEHEEEQQYQEMLIEEIEKVLDDGQRVQFRRMLRPDRKGGKVVGPLDDPKVLAACLKQIEVEDYQKGQLQRIQKDYQEQLKMRGKDIRPEEEKMMRERLLNEVKMVLTEEQREQLERVHARMGGTGTIGQEADLKNPYQLMYALRSLNATSHRLSGEQWQMVREAQVRYKQELQNLPKDDEMGRERVGEQTCQEVISRLTPEQQEALKEAKIPAGMMRGRSRDRDDDHRRGRSRGGRYGRSRGGSDYDDDRTRGRRYR